MTKMSFPIYWAIHVELLNYKVACVKLSSEIKDTFIREILKSSNVLENNGLLVTGNGRLGSCHIALVFSYKMNTCPEYCLKVKVSQSCLTIYDPIDYTVHGILQARILEWVAFPFSRGSSQPRDRTQVSCIADRFFTSWVRREAQEYWSG